MSNYLQATVLFSGGIDSWSVVKFLSSRSYSISPVHIDFGQAAATAERSACRELLKETELVLETIDILSSVEIGIGEIAGRNAMLCSAALTLCTRKPDVLAIGIHAGTPYFDCSPAFFERMDQLIAETTEGATRLLAPFLTWEKPAIIDYATSAGLHLDQTYSCERGEVPPCGECLSCEDRANYL
ncbi:7-cyano-7-deazaguanine synthase [Maricaulis sp.]|uniref:7-cyano-7-deazaguanine synthase n=1 Tax=Maricaulis sp. TaxID=1486257 RepID=UPI000C4B85EA|nr:7-cyano-7-deazaguanine synthase [Maricaulis sp.]MAC89377.1 tRNA methyl transferase-like protein [Maricaulis sp.]